MRRSRLDFLNAEAIKTKLASMTDERRREAVLDVCELAVRRTKLQDPRIDEAIRQMRATGHVTAQALHDLEQCYDELDLYQLELNDNPDDSSLQGLFPNEARQSGAALAVLLCAQMRDLHGAYEAIYDATYSLGKDLNEVERVIDARL